ncbi:hypothetical protein MRQ36_27995 [Micromonospora sp. R77]|uniref:hypothetical protein n=1 Tax=Micromonospora sp. R77 TaxID=2925836 RepID=UPI001F6033F2|nr:hypothetical protein [Micromonospora sp. R77]MCI4066184.1 hypothetical protein [Micromonospora sp. R77]
MSTSCYVGTTDARNPHVVHARFVLADGHPAAVVPTLSLIFAHHGRRDAAALAVAVLAYDWERLDPRITVVSAPAGRQPVPGVGIPVAGGTEPVTVFPLCQARHVDTAWIYLIHATTGTVAVHCDSGDQVARYRLDVCTPAAGVHGRPQPLPRAPQSARCRPVRAAR